MDMMNLQKNEKNIFDELLNEYLKCSKSEKEFFLNYLKVFTRALAKTINDININDDENNEKFK